MLSFNFSPFPTLHSPRLVLRQVVPADVNEIFFFRSNPEMMSFIPKKPATSLQEALDWIGIISRALEQNQGITWGMALKDEPQTIIGTLGFWRTIPEHHRAEIGYQLHTAHRGKGYMLEGLRTILQYGFDQMQLHSVEANVDPLNTASIQLLEKTGFVREAHFKEDYYYDGVFYDSYIYSLLNRNFKR